MLPPKYLGKLPNHINSMCFLNYLIYSYTVICCFHAQHKIHTRHKPLLGKILNNCLSNKKEIDEFKKLDKLNCPVCHKQMEDAEHLFIRCVLNWCMIPMEMKFQLAFC